MSASSRCPPCKTPWALLLIGCVSLGLVAAKGAANEIVIGFTSSLKFLGKKGENIRAII